MKLSVIVPVYNVEKFLLRCLDSLLRQDMKSDEWEVICLNDGSPDNCATILAEYESKYPDIFKITTQENQGLGNARNTGTALAQGEYIGYLDSDDYIIDNAYKYLLENFCDDKPDVLCFDCTYIYTDGKALHDSDGQPVGEIIFDGDGADAYNRWPLPFVWSKFYKRSFILQHQIKSHNVAVQDEVFNFDVFRQHPHLLMVTSCIYRYENGYEGSIMKTTKKEKILVQLEGLLYDIEYINEYLNEGRTSVAPAARRTITMLRSAFNRKIVSVCLSSREWHYYHRKLGEIPLYQMESSNGDRITRWLIAAKQKSATSYPFYTFFTFIRNVIYANFIRPYIVKTNTAVT